ncbi:hypothetical protein [Pseudomonas purpurea]|uniref:hypothetical protein n=1 Tax=Pseudomonas purpurea TaxID=3136737 RepID=UPI003264DEEE
MKFNDVFVDRVERFSLGIEQESGRFYLSIPVSNRLVDYEEYYQIDQACFDAYRANPALALAFLQGCRNRERDELLMLKPGRDRGVAS